MAQRRMFSLKIVDTDDFLDMGQGSQLLYFHLAMRADDDGFVNSPKKILRFAGAKDDDLKVLIAKQFIIPFKSGVIVIRHWKENNYIQSDRKHKTIYQEEMAQLSEDENGVYKMDTKCIQGVSKMDTEVRIGKGRLGEERKEKEGRFTPPTPEEVDDHCQSNGYGIDGHAFVSYYQSNGWKVGKNPMKNWKAAVVTWQKRQAPQKHLTPEDQFKKLYKELCILLYEKFNENQALMHFELKKLPFPLDTIDTEITFHTSGMWEYTKPVEEALKDKNLFTCLREKIYELKTQRNSS